jgi:hypothetical protein
MALDRDEAIQAASHLEVAAKIIGPDTTVLNAATLKKAARALRDSTASAPAGDGLVVMWKDEGEMGPVTIRKASDVGKPQRYDPDRPSAPWMTRAQAQVFARDVGAEFREV